MTFSDKIANVLEVCKLKNLTVYKFIMELCVVLRSQLLSQVQVELEEYMQMCIVRSPFLADLKSGTVDDATFRVSVMGTVMAEWRVNCRVRQQTSKLQREIVKRQAEEQPVPCCSPAWIYQDFPSLLSETKAESLPISVLCDLILKRYDLIKDNEFRDLLCEVQSELQKQQPDNVDQATQNKSETNKNLPTSLVPTTCAQSDNTEHSSLPMRADWFRHYQPAQPYTEVPLFGQTDRSKVAQPNARQHYNAHTTNYSRPYDGQESKRNTSQFAPSRGNNSIESRDRYMAKTTCNRCNGPEVQRHSNHVVHSSSTTKTGSTRDTTVSSTSRKYVRPHSQLHKQAHRHVPISKKINESTPKKTSTQKKDFNLKIDEYLSKVCPNIITVQNTETNSPEFSSAHLGGLVIKIAKKPKRVQVTEHKQPKEELTVKERKRQAFLAHVARIQKKLKKNLKADAASNKTSSNKPKATDTSVCSDAQIKHHTLGTSKSAMSAMVTEKYSSRKRKATASSICPNIQIKCTRLNTGFAVKDTNRKRKATDASLCSSIQTKCARLDTGSAIKALKRHVIKRQH